VATKMKRNVFIKKEKITMRTFVLGKLKAVKKKVSAFKEKMLELYVMQKVKSNDATFLALSKKGSNSMEQAIWVIIVLLIAIFIFLIVKWFVQNDFRDNFIARLNEIMGTETNI
jgi:hypothetical protein